MEPVAGTPCGKDDESENSDGQHAENHKANEDAAHAIGLTPIVASIYHVEPAQLLARLLSRDADIVDICRSWSPARPSEKALDAGLISLYHGLHRAVGNVSNPSIDLQLASFPPSHIPKVYPLNPPGDPKMQPNQDGGRDSRAGDQPKGLAVNRLHSGGRQTLIASLNRL